MGEGWGGGACVCVRDTERERERQDREGARGGNDSRDGGWRESEGPQEGLLKRGQGAVSFCT